MARMGGEDEQDPRPASVRWVRPLEDMDPQTKKESEKMKATLTKSETVLIQPETVAECYALRYLTTKHDDSDLCKECGINKKAVGSIIIDANFTADDTIDAHEKKALETFPALYDQVLDLNNKHQLLKSEHATLMKKTRTLSGF